MLPFLHHSEILSSKYTFQIISDGSEITCSIIICQIMLILIAAFISSFERRFVELIENLEFRVWGEMKRVILACRSPLFSLCYKAVSCLYSLKYLLLANFYRARELFGLRSNRRKQFSVSPIFNSFSSF